METNKKVLLSVRDLHVKFRVRGRILTAIRGIDLDIYDGESIAIVGESGSGKSVFTKTFAGMLDSNGFIDQGSIIFNDDSLNDTSVELNDEAKKEIRQINDKLDEASKFEAGAEVYLKLKKLDEERELAKKLSPEEEKRLEKELKEAVSKATNLENEKMVLGDRKHREKRAEVSRELKEARARVKALQKEKRAAEKAVLQSFRQDVRRSAEFERREKELREAYESLVHGEISEETRERNENIAKEVYLSCGRFPARRKKKLIEGLIAQLTEAMKCGRDLNDQDVRSRVFEPVTFRVHLTDETPEKLHGFAVTNLATLKSQQDWTLVRGQRIATVFQDPMTSLNPIITIGKQITSVIMKHQSVSEIEARRKAIELMHKVGIPHAEERFDDYPFQYSGGMRQRIVIAIALSCQPKILICDEPTTALDVTIQAQILKLIKDLQKEFGYTIVFITHDLGVVANIADRVAVLYAGQIIELGTVHDIFYEPAHPYTWALLSSLPQLAEKNTRLYSITGTPPSLYNEIIGDAFAPRNPYALKIDTLVEPPMFRISDTHYAKTWLLDPNAPKIRKPEGIEDIHSKLIKAFNIQEI